MNSISVVKLKEEINQKTIHLKSPESLSWSVDLLLLFCIWSKLENQREYVCYWRGTRGGRGWEEEEEEDEEEEEEEKKKKKKKKEEEELSQNKQKEEEDVEKGPRNEKSDYENKKKQDITFTVQKNCLCFFLQLSELDNKIIRGICTDYAADTILTRSNK